MAALNRPSPLGLELGTFRKIIKKFKKKFLKKCSLKNSYKYSVIFSTSAESVSSIDTF